MTLDLGNIKFPWELIPAVVYHVLTKRLGNGGPSWCVALKHGIKIKIILGLSMHITQILTPSTWMKESGFPLCEHDIQLWKF